MYVGMIKTRSLEILLKSFHKNYSDLFKKTTRYYCGNADHASPLPQETFYGHPKVLAQNEC